MIAYLRGTVIKKNDKFVVVDVNGVGYKVFINEDDLKGVTYGQAIELHVVSILKRDGTDLYGFIYEENFLFFEILKKIAGIGPKAALKISSSGDVEAFKKAVEDKDVVFFEKIKGIGTKKIQKVILELSGKFSNIKAGKNALSGEAKQIFDTLISLGFDKRSSMEVLSNMPNKLKKTQDKIKYCLKQLSNK